MAKIRNLFNLLKRLLRSEVKSKFEKREKRRRWIFGRFRWKRLPVITAPSLVKERRLSEAEEEQSKHALTVAIATAAAAEAAVAAAQAAAEVVRLTGTPRSYVRNQKGRRELAAIKIQTAYRGYLARKALRALKGLVRLQAIVRGQAVRRQAITTLNGLQSLVRIQSQVRTRRTKVGASQPSRQDKQLEETMLQITSQSGMDDTLPTKEEIDGMFFSRQEALIKAERLKEYLLSLREARNTRKLEESEADKKLNGNLGHWLKQWVDAQEQNSRRDFVICSNLLKKNGEGRMELIGLREIQNHESLSGKRFGMSPPRRSFHKPKQNSIGDKDSLGSPVIPNYMSATESAKARLRSSSMPKQRLELLENFSEHGSPSKNRLSFSSISSDTSAIIKSGKAPIPQQRSPHMKGLVLPIKSDPKAKDISNDSESSLQNWQRQNV